ncbi:enhancer of mRNA decapping, partial [Exophiala xenobiotica]
MASEFIGYTILVTLRSPPNAQLQGVVADVVNQKLLLQNVLLLWNGQQLSSYVIESSAIADLEVAPTQQTVVEEEELSTPVVDSKSAQETSFQTISQSQPNVATYIDPAIISYTKPPSKGPRRPSVQQGPVSPIMIAD